MERENVSRFRGGPCRRLLDNSLLKVCNYFGAGIKWSQLLSRLPFQKFLKVSTSRVDWRSSIANFFFLPSYKGTIRPFHFLPQTRLLYRGSDRGSFSLIPIRFAIIVPWPLQRYNESSNSCHEFYEASDDTANLRSIAKLEMIPWTLDRHHDTTKFEITSQVSKRYYEFWNDTTKDIMSFENFGILGKISWVLKFWNNIHGTL